jgi:hypothetical protein
VQLGIRGNKSQEASRDRTFLFAAGLMLSRYLRYLQHFGQDTQIQGM